MNTTFAHQLADQIKPGAFSSEVDAPDFAEFVAAFAARIDELIQDKELSAEVIAIACERDGVHQEAKAALRALLP